MKKIFLILLILGFSSTIFAQKYPKKDKVYEPKPFEVNLSYGNFTSSSLFDFYSTLQTKLEDTTVLMDNVNNTYRHFSYEYSKTIFNLGGSFRFNEDLSISAGIPISFSSYEENFIGEIYRRHDPLNIYPDTTKFFEKEFKSSQSRTTVDYLQLGLDYRILKSTVVTSKLNLETRIPLFSETLNLVDEKIQITNPFQLATGLNVEFDLRKIRFDLTGKYLFRGGDYKDLIMYGIGLTLATVPNTYLRAHLDFVTNLTDIPENKDFKYYKPIYNESYIRGGAEFKILFTDYLYSIFSYDLTADGKQTLNQSVFNWKVGILF